MPDPIATLRALLAADGRTVYRLALDTGLSAQTVHNLLDGSGGKTVAGLVAIAAALGYRLQWARGVTVTPQRLPKRPRPVKQRDAVSQRDPDRPRRRTRRTAQDPDARPDRGA